MDVCQYQRRTIEVDTILYTGNNLDQVDQFSDGRVEIIEGIPHIWNCSIPVILDIWDHVIRGAGTEHYPVQYYPVPIGIFHKLYEPKGHGKYQKKSVVIEAIQYTGSNLDQVNQFSKGCVKIIDGLPHIWNGKIHMILCIGDYVLPDDRGFFFVCEEKVFADIYDQVN